MSDQPEHLPFCVSSVVLLTLLSELVASQKTMAYQEGACRIPV